MSTEAERQADECKRLASEFATVYGRLHFARQCGVAHTRKVGEETEVARVALYAAIDKLASMIPDGGLAGEADWSGLIVEINYETHRALVRYEGNHPPLCAIVRVDEWTTRARDSAQPATPLATPQQEQPR